MPERRFYTWRQPLRIHDRAYAHPGTTATSACAPIVGGGLVAHALGQVPGSDSLAALPLWLQLWIGVALIAGGCLVLVGLLRTWADLARGWRIEASGWILQLGAWAGLTGLLAYLVPDATLTWPLTLAAAATAALRMRALTHIEREARKLLANLDIDAGVGP